ncbi:hypothetical protein IE53DRAFT_190982 [Violaceomyces palustris]|uniref:Uncharacterized protein n=1 Tax=Violaceomyces palustris TaxID=1673888 RepID=A0ACD0NRV5_9BASI|nr:hypothetical protein IE53DRAFT_190982 [Violaceomyces palustris]
MKPDLDPSQLHPQLTVTPLKHWTKGLGKDETPSSLEKGWNPSTSDSVQVDPLSRLRFSDHGNPEQVSQQLLKPQRRKQLEVSSNSAARRKWNQRRKQSF